MHFDLFSQTDSLRRKCARPPPLVRVGLVLGISVWDLYSTYALSELNRHLKTCAISKG